MGDTKHATFVWGRGYGGMFGPSTHDPRTPIPRHVVKNGVLAFECDLREKPTKLRGWELTSHKHESFAFATEEYECDAHCGQPIRPGQLISVGIRQVEGDMEIENDQYDVQGIDRIHIGCRVCLQEDHDHSPYCNMGMDPLSINGCNVREFPGFAALSDDAKREFLDESGEGPGASLEAVLPPCHGVVAVVTMDPNYQDEAKNLVIQNGGTVHKEVTNETTHLIYGPKLRVFKTIYGEGSPRYQAARRRKLPMLTLQDLRTHVRDKTRVISDEALAQLMEDRAEEERAKEAAKAEKAKERAANKGKRKAAVVDTAPLRSTRTRRGGN